jgi:hypothetical protein
MRPAFTFLLVVAVVPAVMADIITADVYGRATARGRNAQVQYDEEDTLVTSFPYSHVITESYEGAAASAELEVDVDFVKTGYIGMYTDVNPNCRGEVTTGYDITLDQDMIYTIAGSLHFSSARQPEARVWLKEVGPYPNLYDWSCRLDAGSCDVGPGGAPPPGALQWSEFGSLTGVLAAGTTYHFDIWCMVQGSANGSGTASGEISMTLTPVPEPASGLLLLLAVATLRHR